MTTSQDFALEAARKYLQSVVFVDDEIYVPVTAPNFSVDIGSPASMRIYKRSEPVDRRGAPVEATEYEEPEVNGASPFHAKQLVESFARESIVCALYEPQQGFETDSSSEIFKLCERADVVILDWEFHGEAGEKVTSLLAGLVSEGQTTFPHHVRLCAIYTSTPDLTQVSGAILKYFESKNLKVEASGPFKLNAGSTRIVVLGKPTSVRPADQKTAAEVAESYLAKRIVQEFADMHEGVLPSMALHGLASVRSNTKKILDKFQKKIDGAFLIHRGLIFPGDDAFEQIPELLAEELLAVIVDDWVSEDKTHAIAKDVIDRFELKTAWKNKKNEDTAPGVYAKALLLEGAGKVRKKIELNPVQLQQLHDEVGGVGLAGKERLAALYTSRTQYGDRRTLQFGTIVRYKEEITVQDGGVRREDRFAICLMPLCDCVRLKNGRSYKFPFWCLRDDNDGASSKGIVVELPNEDKFIELFCMGKPRDHLSLATFNASATGTVLATSDENRFLFSSLEFGSIEWIAQLKPSHAQRIAHDISTSFSRVGVLEAEWLRLKADRQQ